MLAGLFSRIKRVTRPKRQSSYRQHNCERGNVFFIVIMGYYSLCRTAVLMMTFFRGIRQGEENITKKQEQLAATDILSHAQKVERTIGYVQHNRTSENDISLR